MSRLRAVVLVAALGVTSVPAVPAGATAETCRGLPATIVGTPDAELTGTSGPDVVVTNGAVSVDTGDGDDVVCTTETPSRSEGVDVEVDAGPGNDVVDTTAEHRNPVTGTTLGDGDDVFEGGPADDSVDARDQGHDTVRTGGGNDFVGTGSRTGVDDDLVDTQASGDQLSVDGNISPSSQIAGGPGRDSLHINVRTPGRWVFDNRTGVARHDDTAAWRWDGIEQFFLTQVKTVGRLRFIGGASEDLLYVATSGFAGARLGHGNDQVFVASPRSLSRTPAIKGGVGRDRLAFVPYGTRSPVPRAELDLGSGLLQYDDRKRRRTSLLVHHFESVDVHAHSVRVIGSHDADEVVAWACDVHLDGRAGDDRLAMLSQGDCGPGTGRSVFGGPGDDRLSGSGFADLLVGGPGSDRVDGFEGRDRCDAEIEEHCE